MKSGNLETMEKKTLKRYGVAGLIMMALALGGCGQPEVTQEPEQQLGIPITGMESPVGGVGSSEASQAVSLSGSGTAQSPESSTAASALDVGDAGQDGNPADSGILQPTYIGSWKVTEYCYPSTPCGLSQLEVDVLIGSELIYAPESFSCNQRVVESEGFGYELSFYDSLTEFEQDFSVSVNGWFEGGDTGKVKCGYLTIEEGIFGDSFSYMEEQPDKMLICYYGVVFLAVREQTPTVSAGQYGCGVAAAGGRELY